jgi:hypothetical protein
MARERIYARSPYYVSYRDNANPIAKVELKVWAYRGTIVSDRPTNPTYTLKKESSVNQNGYEYWVFEIAELLKDYLPKVGNPTTFPPTAIWASYQLVVTWTTGFVASAGITNFAVLDGYVNFEEGSQSINYKWSTGTFSSINVRPNQDLVLTETGNNSAYVTDTDKYSTYAAMFVDNTPVTKTIDFTAVNGATTSISLTQTHESDDIIQYAQVSYQFINYAGAISKMVHYFTTITNFDVTDCIPDHTNNSTGTIIWFVNKYGAIDKTTFIGSKVDRYDTSKNEYRANIVGALSNDAWGYDTYTRQKSILNKKGNAKFTLNTGWIAENYNDKIKDLLLAEQVWVQLGAGTNPNVYPVNITTSSIQEKTDANEKIVNYAIDFEYANDIQNNIR